jgi:hypothetical protein
MSSLRITASLLALASAVLGTALPAGAQGASPIAITSCQVLQYVPTRAHPFWRPFGPYPYGSPYTDGIQIAYVNHASQPAKRVAFETNYRGNIQHIIDAGTFSPGVTINHTFGDYTGLAWLGPNLNSCRVVAVRFADGSDWHSPTRPRRQAGPGM